MTDIDRRSALAIGLAAAAGSAPARAAGSGRDSAAARQLRGTWRHVRYENIGADGKVDLLFGAEPKGYFTYDATGHLSIHIMRNPPAKPFRLAPDENGIEPENARGSEAEVRDAYTAYVGYFGTWRVNPEGTAVIHIVEGALRPSYIATEQVRPFSLVGDTLIVRPPPWRDGTTFYRELRRVR